MYDVGKEIILLNAILRFLGFDPANGKFKTWKILFYFVTTVFVVVNALWFVCVNWADMNARVVGVQYMTNCVLLGCLTLVYVFNWDSVILLLRIIENLDYRVPFNSSEERKAIIGSERRVMTRVVRGWYTAITVNATIGCVIPILSVVVALVTTKPTDISATQLVLLFPFYYPPGYQTVPVFIFAYFCQNANHLIISGYCYLSASLSFLSMHTIVTELKLLRLSVTEMEEILAPKDMPYGFAGEEGRGNHQLNPALKSYITYFVNHHRHIYRKIEEINSGLQWFATVANFGVSVYLCQSLFYIVKGDDISIKIQACGICSLWIVNIFCFNYYGEYVRTEDDNLRKALYECPWFDKPEWFKKDVKIIMARIQKQAEIQPIGLFVLCLESFATCMNAAYSYYNFLYSFS